MKKSVVMGEKSAASRPRCSSRSWQVAMPKDLSVCSVTCSGGVGAWTHERMGRSVALHADGHGHAPQRP